MDDLVKKTEEGKFEISADLSKETISFLNYMLRYDPKKRLDINQLSEHKFITKDAKYFTRIDRNKLPNNLEESHLVFNTKGSYIQELNKDAFEEKKELDEYEIELKNKLNEAEEKFKENKKNKKNDENNHENIKDIEKLIYESIEIINGDAMSIEPKLIPFIPGVEKNILLEKN